MVSSLDILSIKERTNGSIVEQLLHLSETGAKFLLLRRNGVDCCCCKSFLMLVKLKLISVSLKLAVSPRFSAGAVLEGALSFANTVQLSAEGELLAAFLLLESLDW